MEQILIGCLFSFIVTFYAIPVIIKIAELKKLYDIPNERKVHVNPIPSLGGLGIFVGFITSLLLTVTFAGIYPEFQYYTAALLIIFFLGLKDDIMVLTPWKKLIGQIVVATILVFKAKLLIAGMDGFLGIGKMDTMGSYLLTYFTILVIINAFNLLDGVDGLAGSVGFISCVVFAILFLMGGNIAYSVLGFTMAGSILAFLIYNYAPAKIFMGDTGSMLIGTVNVILAVKFIEIAPSFQAVNLKASAALGFGIILMPLLDTLRVFALRIFSRRSPFSPDRNHLHHLLLDCGFSHLAVTLTISLASLFFIGFAFLMRDFGTTMMIFSMTALFFVFTGVLYLFKKKPVLSVVSFDEAPEYKPEVVNDVKLVSIFPAATAAAAVLEEESIH